MDFSEVILLVVSLLVFAWMGAITFLLVRVYRTFLKLTQGVSEKDLKSILNQLLETIGKNEKTEAELLKKIEELKEEGLVSIQKVGLVRYNPFSDTGGNQSFVLALLDGKNNGLLITSLHSREATRVFAKPVIAGKESDYEFSKEEIQAIVEAQKKVKNKK